MTDIQTCLTAAATTLGAVALGAWIGRAVGRINENALECDLKSEIATVRYLLYKAEQYAEYYRKKYEELAQKQRRSAEDFSRYVGDQVERILREESHKWKGEE